MHTKSSIILLIFIMLTSCTQNSSSWSEKNYRHAEESMKQGNSQEAFLFYRAAASSPTLSDSVSYWWKATCRIGEIFFTKMQLQDAQDEFTHVLDFAQRHKLDSVEYAARYRLFQIAYLQGNYKTALSHFQQAYPLASNLFLKVSVKQLQADSILVHSAYALNRHRELSDTARTLLQRLATDSTNIRKKAEALKWLAIQEGKSLNASWNNEALSFRDTLWDKEMHSLSEQMAQERAVQEKEYNNLKRLQQVTLCCILIAFALMFGGGIYAVTNYRRKHELSRIRLILDQKEQTIQILESRQESTANLLYQIQEKEKRIEERMQQDRRLKEIAKFLQSQGKDIEELIQLTREIEKLQVQLKQRKNNQTKAEAIIRRHHLYDLAIGQKLPAPGNPHPTEKKDFDGLLAKSENRIIFLQEMDHCFNHFATGLRNITPGLTDEDAVYCCLFRLNIRPTDIAILMATSRSNVSKRRIRIESKLSLNGSTNQTPIIQDASKC